MKLAGNAKKQPGRNNGEKNRNRFFSLLLLLVMLFDAAPAAALAENVELPAVTDEPVLAVDVSDAKQLEINLFEGSADFSLDGSIQILLSDLISQFIGLGIELPEVNLSDVASVKFTGDHAVTVQQVSGVISYNNIQDADVGENDFLLNSMVPFTSEEQFTLALTNGETLRIGMPEVKLAAEGSVEAAGDVRATVTFDRSAGLPASITLTADVVEDDEKYSAAALSLVEETLPNFKIEEAPLLRTMALPMMMGARTLNMTSLDAETPEESDEPETVTRRETRLAGVFDLTILDCDIPLQPDAPVTVTVEVDEPIPENSTVYAVHFTDEGAAETPVPATVEDGTKVSFPASGFSVYAIAYTIEIVEVVNNSAVINLSFTDYEPYPEEGADATFLYDTDECNITVGVDAVLSLAQADGVTAESTALEGFEIDLKDLTAASFDGGVTFDDGLLVITGDGSIELTDGTKTLTVNIHGLKAVKEQIMEAEGVSIEVIEGNVPLGSGASYTPHSEEETLALVEQYITSSKRGEENSSSEVAGYSAADLKIVWNEDELPVEGLFKVTVAKESLIPAGMKLDKLYHIHDGKVEELTATETEDGLEFTLTGFSDIVASYTVDFYFGEYEYHLDGGGEITLSALFAVLGIERDVADVVNVVFSDPALLAVERNEDDWTLTSLQAFDTVESLTIDFANGKQIVVRVEDAQYQFKVCVNDSNAGYLSSTYLRQWSTGGYVWADPVEKNGDYVTSFTIPAGKESDSQNLHYGVVAHAREGYDFIYWLVLYADGATEVKFDTTLPNSTQLTGNTTFIAFFAPSNAHLIRLVYPTNGTPSFTSGGRNIERQYYFYSTDSSCAHITADTSYPIVDWYSVDNLVTSEESLLLANSADFDTRVSATASLITKDLVLHPVCRAPKSYTIYYKSTFTLKGGTTQVITKVTPESETVAENASATGSVAWRENNCGRYFLGWVDKDLNFVKRATNYDDPTQDELTFVPSGDQIYDGAEYTALFAPYNYFAVSVNDELMGKITGESVWWTNASTVKDINSENHIILVMLKSDNSNVWQNHLALGGLVAEPTDVNKFTFDYWLLDGSIHLPFGSAILKEDDIAQYFTTNGVHTLQAVFSEKKTVTYDLGQIQQVGNNAASYQHWVDVPWCSNHIGFANESGWTSAMTNALTSLGNEQYIMDIQNNTVIAPLLYSYTYNPLYSGDLTRVSQTNNGYNLLTHTFRGWKRSDTGALVTPGTTLTNVTASLTLTAVWDAYFPEKGKYEAWNWANGNDQEPVFSENRMFRYNTNTCGFFVRLFDSTFDKGDTGTYTDCLYTSRLFIGGSGSFKENGSVNGARADFFGNSDETDRNIIDTIDSRIRAIGNGWLASDQQYTNNKYAAFSGAQMQLEGAFPSDDFIFGRIRQWNLSAPANRKIQINGTQIPQDMLTSDYFDLKWYVLKDQENSWHIDGMLIPKYAKLVVVKTFVGAADAVAAAQAGYSITVEEQNARGDNADNRTLNLSAATYQDTENHQYIWVLDQLLPLQEYKVTETQNTVTANGITYTVTPSYQITNTRQTTTSGSGYEAMVEHAYSYAPSVTWPSIQTVAFTNQYTEPYVMTIMKQDGTTLHGLKGVTFDFVMKDSNNQVVHSEACNSDSNGRVSIHFKNTLQGNFTFTLDERPYDGYQALAEVSGNVQIGAQGEVTLSNVHTMINGVNTTIAPDPNDPSIIYIINHPERKRVVVSKIWTNEMDAKPVTMQLLRNGVPVQNMYVVLGASETTAVGVTPVKVTGWTYTWDDLPAYVDGEEVIYTAREEWIGEPGGVDSIHYNTANDSDGYKEYIVNQSQTISHTTENDINVTIATVRVENTKDSGQVMFSKVDTKNKVVAGAQFVLYENTTVNGEPHPTWTREGDAVYTADSNGIVLIQGLSLGYHWIKEYSVPAGYTLNENIYLLDIKSHNSTLYECIQVSPFTRVRAITEIVNQPFTASIKVIKTGDNNELLSSAVFSLHRKYTYSDTMAPAPIRGYEALTTNDSGVLINPNAKTGEDNTLFVLEEGTYYLKEESAPAGYTPLENTIKLVVADPARTGGSSSPVTATIGNEPMNVSTEGGNQVLTVPNTTGMPVTLRKRVGEAYDSSKPALGGAEFVLYKQIDYPNGSAMQKSQFGRIIVDEFKSDNMTMVSRAANVTNKGIFYRGYLPAGRYVLVETKAPTGYVKLVTPIELWVDVANGEAHFKYREYDVHDTASWTEPPKGSDNTFSVYVNNTPTGGLKITKTVKLNNASTTDARTDGTYTFTVFQTDGTTPATNQNGVQIPAQTITVTNGVSNPVEVIVNDLTPGTYVVKETASTNTNITLDSQKTVIVSAGTSISEEATASFENNYETTTITLTKTWDDSADASHRPTESDFLAAISLKAGSMDVTSTYAGPEHRSVTQHNNIWTITWTDLPKNRDNAGTAIVYTLEENTALIAYYAQTINTSDFSTNTWTFTNTLNETNIKIVKVNANTQAALTGAVFTLEKQNSEGIYHTVTGYTAIEINSEDGEILTKLTDGSYKLYETQAPAGFNRLTDPIYFTITNRQVTWTDATGNQITSNNMPLMVGYTAATATDPATFTIGNTPGVELPSTGGHGTTLYTITGLSLLLGAAFFLLLHRKKETT